MPAPPNAAPHVQRIVRYFETLTPASLAAIGDVYTADAHFSDPFNDVRGLDAVRRIYQRMFETLAEPRFEVTEVLAEDTRCLLVWDFHFRRANGQPWRIHGSSLLHVGADGRIHAHRDYWDAGSQVYERVPVLGGLLRLLKRRLA